ncbi:carbohydrate kinase family protein [Yoonia sp. MH D7]
MSKQVLCAGRLYCDLVFADTPRMPTAGTEVFAPKLSLHTGGGAFITGATLAHLGLSVSQFSTLPAAPFDTIVLADLAAHGIDSQFCKAAEADVDPQVTVAIATAGDRAFLTRADGPATPDPSTLDFAAFSHLHIGELRTLQEMPMLLDLARKAGLTVSLDCGWQDEFDPRSANLIAEVDVFLPSESEAIALLRAGVPEICAPLTVVKCGDNGARARAIDDNDWTTSKGPRVTVVDATGAGDSFNAGFLSGWLAHEPLGACLEKGNACGAAAVQASGGASHLKSGI